MFIILKDVYTLKEKYYNLFEDRKNIILVKLGKNLDRKRMQQKYYIFFKITLT